ncbi:MAG: DUF4405 domain-containing protein [Hyphomicrobiales bacterium]|nr:MAG: DUF4405 domain-containing protein [Hyphomicrobiales bacterium]
MFQNIVNKYATTFTTTLFIISAVSGVFIFFHTAQDIFKAMHEWLSMVLLVPVVFHLYKNWNSFLTYFKRKTIYIPTAISLVAAIAFGAATMGGGGGNPMVRVFHAMENATVAEVAPLFDATADELTAKLTDAGFKVAGGDETLKTIAGNSGRSGRDIVFLVSSGK